jgi:hypothetical protein
MMATLPANRIAAWPFPLPFAPFPLLLPLPLPLPLRGFSAISEWSFWQ